MYICVRQRTHTHQVNKIRRSNTERCCSVIVFMFLVQMIVGFFDMGDPMDIIASNSSAGDREKKHAGASEPPPLLWLKNSNTKENISAAVKKGIKMYFTTKRIMLHVCIE